MVQPVSEWIKHVDQDTLQRFRIDPDHFNDYKVMPRLLFGKYLEDQFTALLGEGEASGFTTNVYKNACVVDIADDPESEKVAVRLKDGSEYLYDHVIICTGHRWPENFEGIIKGYFDSPYPPVKLQIHADHPVALKGSSLTAIDAIRTLARANGNFSTAENGKVIFKLSSESPHFRIVMHSKGGLLPAIRFHLEDSHLLKDSVMAPELVEQYRAENEGFLSLDTVFDVNFKQLFKEHDPETYEKIKDTSIEEFVKFVMDKRKQVDPFKLFFKEFLEAEESIMKEESVYWKELLAVLSFAMNYPAKYFSAEDMLRLQKVLMPLISIVIAFVPQSSVKEMLALHNEGVLEIVPVGDDSRIEPQKKGGIIYHFKDSDGQLRSDYYQTFVDCVGQPHLSYKKVPFESLRTNKTISPARLKFRDAEQGKKIQVAEPERVEKDGFGDYYLQVPGIKISDNFQVMDYYESVNPRVIMMAVPYIGGYNPDYSGLDFCEAASEAIAKGIFNLQV
ncbi:MAG: hypothetical protein EOO02_19000 [Chitinophagaceae bacterium]|nr:MAG: hypothetical protein EOO02_19000 [Chitinophagaceae bacterium]